MSPIEVVIMSKLAPPVQTVAHVLVGQISSEFIVTGTIQQEIHSKVKVIHNLKYILRIYKNSISILLLQQVHHNNIETYPMAWNIGDK